MKTYEVSEEIIKAILAYLYEKPYKEVYLGIQALESLKEIKSNQSSSESNQN